MTMTVIGKDGAWAQEGARTLLSFRDAEEWADFNEGKDLAILIGDPDCGPLIEATSRSPEPEEPFRAPAHGHPSDNWRITLQGTTNMGRSAYTDGQFRFQDGGVPYAGDNLAWGPDGGFGIIVFADRRGSPIRFVDPDHEFQAGADEGAQMFADKYGFELRDPCPGAIRTTIGETSWGRMEGNFSESGQWPEAVPGVRVLTSLCGDVAAGPVLVLLRCEPGKPAHSAGTLQTEVFHSVVGGSCVVEGSIMKLGDAWLTGPGDQSEVVAGPDGLSQLVVFGDRRELKHFQSTAAGLGRDLAISIVRAADELSIS